MVDFRKVGGKSLFAKFSRKKSIFAKFLGKKVYLLFFWGKVYFRNFEEKKAHLKIFGKQKSRCFLEKKVYFVSNFDFREIDLALFQRKMVP